MPALVLRKCCCFIDLKTGGFLIGYLCLIEKLIFIILTTVVLCIGGVVFADDGPQNAKTREAVLDVIIMAGTFIALLLLDVGFVITLLVGLHKDKPGLLKIYLLYDLTLFGIFVIGSIVNGLISRSDVTVGYVIFVLIEISWQTFVILNIRSVRYQMKERSAVYSVY